VYYGVVQARDAVLAASSNVFGKGIQLNDRKRVLLSVRDAMGRLVQYTSAHSIVCVIDGHNTSANAAGAQQNMTDAKHARLANGSSAARLDDCSLKEKGAPNIAHFRFTHEAIELLWRKLRSYTGNMDSKREKSKRNASLGVAVASESDDSVLKGASNMHAHVASYWHQTSIFVSAEYGTQNVSRPSRLRFNRKMSKLVHQHWTARHSKNTTAGYLFTADAIQRVQATCKNGGRLKPIISSAGLGGTRPSSAPPSPPFSLEERCKHAREDSDGNAGGL